jgi:hypothetical protein
MAIDPSNFHRVNVADTCAVWNILSSETLHSAAKKAGCSFCVTGVVQYELLVKPRSQRKACDDELRARLGREQAAGGFPSHACTLDDLRMVSALEERKKLGKGELSSIALAMRLYQAVITDDRKATKLSREAGHNLTQTTPHLLSWLEFNDALSETEITLIMQQHAELNGTLVRPFHDALEMARQCKANTGGAVASPTATATSTAPA